MNIFEYEIYKIYSKKLIIEKYKIKYEKILEYL